MNTVWFVLLYILHMASTYLVQRQILKVSNEPQYHPIAFMVLLWFVPIVGLFTSLLILVVELVSNRSSNKNREENYKKIFNLK